QIETTARESTSPITRRDAYLRASNYWRTAEFFLHGLVEDPRARETYERQIACFRGAVAHMPHVTRVAIPFEGAVLEGYFYRADGDGPRPTVIMHSGFDGSCEEMH